VSGRRDAIRNDKGRGYLFMRWTLDAALRVIARKGQICFCRCRGMRCMPVGVGLA
jgi:hypothetical protein